MGTRMRSVFGLGLAALLALPLFGPLACAPRLPMVAPEEVGLSSEQLASVHSVLDALVVQKKVAGGVALVARDGRVAYLEALGMRDVEKSAPMTVDTIFRICSMTKPITSAGILILMEEGQLDLNDPVSKFVPELRDMKVAVRNEEGEDAEWTLVDADREITIFHLLTHTSGIAYGFFGKEYFSERLQEAGVSDGIIETEGTMGDNVRRLAEVPLMFQPGTEWEYGLNTDVLGHVIEVVSGRTLEEFLAARIFEPLGMNDTHFRLPEEKEPRLATVYRPGEDGEIEPLPAGRVQTGAAVYSSSYPLDRASRYFSGGAGLVSTPRDYAKFLQMLLNGGELDGVRILEEETVEQMTSQQVEGIELDWMTHGDGFGLGVAVVTEDAAEEGLGSVGTFSWAGFYHTYFWADPQEELIGIVMTQLYPWDHLSLFSDYRHAVYDALVESDARRVPVAGGR